MAGLPDYLIIGGQRCGTTSLYAYLIEHPAVRPAAVKEVHYFDLFYRRGLEWYREQFPAPAAGTVTGEASPYYSIHPHAPRRIAATLPHAKIIVLVRNPVDRAYSHYLHEVGMACETLPFVEALEREEQRLRGELERMQADEHYASFNHQHYSYLLRGRYIEQLRAWAPVVPRGHLLLIQSEEFFAEPAHVLARVFGFLGVEDRPSPAYAPWNETVAEPMEPGVRARLQQYFAPFNRQLYELLGADLGWDR